MFKNTFILCVLLLTSISVYGQSGGLQIHGGYFAALNSDDGYSPSGIRGGVRVIADARLIGGSMHFLVGGGYGVMSINSSSGLGFSSDTYNFYTGRIGIGFNLISFSRDVRLRSKFIGSVHFVGDIETDKIDNQDYRRINDSYGGVSTGLGLDIGWITVDLEYELGLINMIFEKPDTKLDIISLTAGFMF